MMRREATGGALKNEGTRTSLREDVPCIMQEVCRNDAIGLYLVWLPFSGRKRPRPES